MHVCKCVLTKIHYLSILFYTSFLKCHCIVYVTQLTQNVILLTFYQYKVINDIIHNFLSSFKVSHLVCVLCCQHICVGTSNISSAPWPHGTVAWYWVVRNLAL